jgi:hypothetical protein
MKFKNIGKTYDLEKKSLFQKPSQVNSPIISFKKNGEQPAAMKWKE